MHEVTELTDLEIDEVGGGIRMLMRAIRDGLIYDSLKSIITSGGDGSYGGGVGSQSGCHNQYPW